MVEKMNNEWSNLPQELADSIANRLHSNVELLRMRAICKPWRSEVSTKKRVHNRNHKHMLSPFKGNKCALSPAAFFRVVLSSYPKGGWLIKTQVVSESGKKYRLLSPLSRVSIKSTEKTLDLLDYTVSEIHQSYDIHYSEYFNNEIRCNFARVIPVKDLVFGVTHNKQIWCLKSGEQENGENAWTRIKDEEVELFSDIIVHKGQIYALDSTGAIWWISKSELDIFQYGPSTPMDYYDIDFCKDKRIVEFCGELCVVHRFCKTVRVKGVDVEMTIGFKVYKMDGELCEWVEVKSLGDKTFVMAADSCFSVSASEYYGCLENSIYFTDEEKENIVKVFKLCDGSITKMMESKYQSCFQMFSPPFA